MSDNELAEQSGGGNWFDAVQSTPLCLKNDDDEDYASPSSIASHASNDFVIGLDISTDNFHPAPDVYSMNPNKYNTAIDKKHSIIISPDESYGVFISAESEVNIGHNHNNHDHNHNHNSNSNSSNNNNKRSTGSILKKHYDPYDMRENPHDLHEDSSYRLYKGIIRPHVRLTLKLLDEIGKSIAVFRPSKSLADLTKRKSSKNMFQIDATHTDQALPAAEIDIVISGGGLKGYFMCGAVSILKHELQRYNVKIGRVSGASAGAWAAMFICTGVSSAAWMESYFACKDTPEVAILDVYQRLWPWFSSMMPPNAYELCTGKLFISISELTVFGFQNRIISEFASNQELFDCCVASSSIPSLTRQSWICRFRGKLAYDGGMTNNTPVFTDGIRRQLVFRLYNVEYPWRLLVNAGDSCIDTLVLRGALLMKRFLEGEGTDCITWLEEKEGKDALVSKPNHSLRVFFVPFTVLGFILDKSIKTFKRFFQDVFSSLKPKQIDDQLEENEKIIPFNEYQNKFSSSSAKYLTGAVYAGFVDLLRRLNLLL